MHNYMYNLRNEFDAKVQKNLNINIKSNKNMPKNIIFHFPLFSFHYFFSNFASALFINKVERIKNNISSNGISK